MSWQSEIDELNQRRQWSEEMGGTERVSRQRQRGYLNIRERIDGVVDCGSFREVGKLAGSGSYQDGKVTAVKPAPYVMGLAKIDGRPSPLAARTAQLAAAPFKVASAWPAPR